MSLKKRNSKSSKAARKASKFTEELFIVDEDPEYQNERTSREETHDATNVIRKTIATLHPGVSRFSLSPLPRESRLLQVSLDRRKTKFGAVKYLQTDDSITQAVEVTVPDQCVYIRIVDINMEISTNSNIVPIPLGRKSTVQFRFDPFLMSANFEAGLKHAEAAGLAMPWMYSSKNSAATVHEMIENYLYETGSSDTLPSNYKSAEEQIRELEEASDIHVAASTIMASSVSDEGQPSIGECLGQAGYSLFEMIVGTKPTKGVQKNAKGVHKNAKRERGLCSCCRSSKTTEDKRKKQKQ